MLRMNEISLDAMFEHDTAVRDCFAKQSSVKALVSTSMQHPRNVRVSAEYLVHSGCEDRSIRAHLLVQQCLHMAMLNKHHQCFGNSTSRQARLHPDVPQRQRSVSEEDSAYFLYTDGAHSVDRATTPHAACIWCTFGVSPKKSSTMLHA